MASGTTPPAPALLRVRATAQHARPAAFPRALGVAGLATATTVAFAPLAPALADPTPSADQVARQVDALDGQADAAVEQFLQAEQRVTEVKRRADAAAQRAAAEQARLDAVKAQMSDLVAAAYRRGGSDQLAAVVVDGGPQTYLDRAATLDRIAQSQADVLAQIATARSRASAQQKAAERELAALQEANTQLAARKDQVERTLKAQQDLLAGLKASERARVDAARAAAAARATTAPAPAPAPARASRATRPAPVAPSPTYSGPASGRAAVAVDEAKRQVGKPYRWGAAGPDSFDCSGLTMFVWRKAGVSLPHSSQQQYNSGRKVARADIQPGDLVYYGGSSSSIGHVGIYIGGDQMISATHTGDYVRVQYAFRRDFVGATRP